MMPEKVRDSLVVDIINDSFFFLDLKETLNHQLINKQEEDITNQTKSYMIKMEVDNRTSTNWAEKILASPEVIKNITGNHVIEDHQQPRGLMFKDFIHSVITILYSSMVKSYLSTTSRTKTKKMFSI